MAELFGFEIKRKREKELPSVVLPAPDDGATVTSSFNAGAYYSLVVDMEGIVKNENDLIRRYREVAQYPDCDTAIDDIVNEAICQDDDGKNVQIVMDDLKVPDKIKDAIKTEFATIVRMLNYNNMAQDIFRRWYVDGRMYYHIIVDRDNPTEGIKELRQEVNQLKKQIG